MRHHCPPLSRAALLAALCLAGATQAHAVDIQFDGLRTSPDEPFFATQGDVFAEAGYWLMPFAYQPDHPNLPSTDLDGVFVGALVDGSTPQRLAETCMAVACPSGNGSTFYAGLNDSVLAMGRQDGQLFSLNSFQVGFISASVDVSSINYAPLLFTVQGTDRTGATRLESVLLPAPKADGLGFYGVTLSQQFQSYQLKDVAFYGLACDVSGHCSAFNSNQAQFGLDNIATTVAAAVPEPSQWLLMAMGLTAVGGIARRRGRAA